MALTTVAGQCPRQLTAQPFTKSRYLLPLWSSSHEPCPRTKTSSGRLVISISASTPDRSNFILPSCNHEKESRQQALPRPILTQTPGNARKAEQQALAEYDNRQTKHNNQATQHLHRSQLFVQKPGRRNKTHQT